MTPQKEPVSASITVHDTGRARRPVICIRASHHAPPTLSASVADGVFDVYTRALAAAGGVPIGIPLNLPEAALRAIFEQLDGLCLPGGADVSPAYYGENPHPEFGEAAWGVEADSDATEFLITRWALDAEMPILGICRGIQMLNVAARGSLYQDIAAQVPGPERHSYSPADTPWERTTHRICLTPDSQLARILGVTEIWTNSFHHQAVKDVAPGFVASGRAEDGLIEGIEAASHPFAVGVQWHPEWLYGTDAASRRLFAAFISAARNSPHA